MICVVSGNQVQYVVSVMISSAQTWIPWLLVTVFMVPAVVMHLLTCRYLTMYLRVSHDMCSEWESGAICGIGDDIFGSDLDSMASCHCFHGSSGCDASIDLQVPYYVSTGVI